MNRLRKRLLSIALATVLVASNFGNTGIVFADPGDIEINDTNFPDAVFRDHLLNDIDDDNQQRLYDKNGDGILSQAERESIEYLGLSSGMASWCEDGEFKNVNGISSLKGIEYFPNLTYLDCFGNNLESIDMSANTKLKSLACNGNPVKGLILTNNTDLEELEVTFFGASIDISNNSKLRSLDLAESRLPEIDITGAPILDNLVTTTQGKIEFPYGRKKPTFVFGHRSSYDPTTGDYQQALFLSCDANTTIIASSAFTPPVMPESEKLFEINEQNFPDENLRNYIQNEYDYNNDYFIDEYENEDILGLYISGMEITDLTGIALLTELESIVAYENELSSVDISQNKNLTSIYFAFNNLEELDVSENEALEYIDIEGNNITSIDLSKNSNLKGIEVRHNGMKSIDVSNNPNLITLIIDDNDISTVNLANNTELQYFSARHTTLGSIDVTKCTKLRKLKLDNSDVTSVDISKCTPIDTLATTDGGRYYSEHGEIPYLMFGEEDYMVYPVDESDPVMTLDAGTTITASAEVVIEEPETVAEINEESFPDDNFREYVKSEFDIDKDNKLSTLEIELIDQIMANNYGITSLKGIEFFSKLRYLSVGTNQIESIDLSNNPEIDTVYASFNKITSVILPDNHNITELGVSNNKLKTIDFKGNIPRELYIDNNDFTTLDLTGSVLEEMLANDEYETEDIGRAWRFYYFDDENYTLTSLSVDKDVEITSAGFTPPEPAPYLGIEVSANTFEDETFCNYIENTFDLDHNFFLSDEEIAAVKEIIIPDNLKGTITSIDGIGVFSELEKLDCSNMGISGLNIGSTTPKLKQLDCSGNSIDVLYLEMIPGLADAIKTKTGTYSEQGNVVRINSNVAVITFYKTTLDANGGSVNVPYIISKEGDSINLPVPTRAGYKFKGWSFAKNAGGGNTGAYVPGSDATLYATWEEDVKKPATPKLIATFNGAKGIGAQWEKVAGATSYIIWRKYQGKWTKIKTVSATDSSLQFSGNKIMYTDTAVKSNYGYGYIYSVPASNAAGTSSYNTTGLAAYRLINPEITKVTVNGFGKVTVNWTKVACQGYEVQYATEADAKKDKWTKAKEVKYGKTSQVISGLKIGQKYIFRIRCEKTNKDRGTTWSQYSGWKSIRVK